MATGARPVSAIAAPAASAEISATSQSMPFRRRAMARLIPAIPPPTMSTRSTAAMGPGSERGQRPVPVVWRPVWHGSFRRRVEHHRVDAADPVVIDRKPLAQDVAALGRSRPANEHTHAQNHAGFLIHYGEPPRSHILNIEARQVRRAVRLRA